MQTARILQAVVLMLVVALAASCTATKEYASKLFPAKPAEKDSQAMALRFLELDKLDPDQDNWVSTDIIMGRDTGSKTAALDQLSQVFPAAPILANRDTAAAVDTRQTTPVYVNAAPVVEKHSLTKRENNNAVVIKNSSAPANKTTTVVSEVKNSPVVTAEAKTTAPADQPVARSYTNGEVREKKSRDDNQ